MSARSLLRCGLPSALGRPTGLLLECFEFTPLVYKMTMNRTIYNDRSKYIDRLAVRWQGDRNIYLLEARYETDPNYH